MSAQLTLYCPDARIVQSNKVHQLSKPDFQIIMVRDPHPNAPSGILSCHMSGKADPEELRTKTAALYEIFEGKYALVVHDFPDADTFKIPAKSQAA